MKKNLFFLLLVNCIYADTNYELLIADLQHATEQSHCSTIELYLDNNVPIFGCDKDKLMFLATDIADRCQNKIWENSRYETMMKLNDYGKKQILFSLAAIASPCILWVTSAIMNYLSTSGVNANSATNICNGTHFIASILSMALIFAAFCHARSYQIHQTYFIAELNWDTENYIRAMNVKQLLRQLKVRPDNGEYAQSLVKDPVKPLPDSCNAAEAVCRAINFIIESNSAGRTITSADIRRAAIGESSE